MMDTAKAPIRRSPPNPERTLEWAIEDARKLYHLIGKEPVYEKDSRIAAAWKLGEKSSGWSGRSAALKQYGLLYQEIVAGEKRVVLTPLAFKIIRVKDEGTEINPALLQEAVMNVNIYPDLLKKCGDNLNPEEVERHLLDQGFIPKRARQAMRIFIDNIKYAGLYGEQDQAQTATASKKSDRPPSLFGDSIFDELRISFGGDNVAVTITIEGEMTLKQLVERLQQLVE